MSISVARGAAAVGLTLPQAARVYANVNLNKPEGYWNYHNYNIIWGSPHRYKVIDRVGRGKYSTVFEGIDEETQGKVTIKALKTIPYPIIQREVSILHHLRGVETVSELLDTVQDPATKMMSLVLRWQEAVPFRQFYRSLSNVDLRSYCRSLLNGLDEMHSRGIMHRDVKPSNVLFDPVTHQLHIIDFGLSEYYFPAVNYNVRVASRCYKAPEILISHGRYSYSLDMWGFGCILAALEPFFRGADAQQQLLSISQVLGTQGLLDYCHQNQVAPPVQLPDSPSRPWESFLSERNAEGVPLEAIDLLSRCLVYDPLQRPTAREALGHPFLRESP